LKTNSNSIERNQTFENEERSFLKQKIPFSLNFNLNLNYDINQDPSEEQKKHSYLHKSINYKEHVNTLNEINTKNVSNNIFSESFIKNTINNEFGLYNKQKDPAFEVGKNNIISKQNYPLFITCKMRKFESNY